MARTGYEHEARSNRAAQGRRDNSLRRVRSLTKGTVVVAAAAVGVLGLYVAKALPGHSATPASPSTAATTPPPTTTPATAPSGAQSVPATTSPPVTAPPSPPVTTQSPAHVDRKSTRLNSSHLGISYAVF